MTQFSWNFACVPAAGDANPLTAENLAAARLFMGNFDPVGAGVIYWTASTPANVLFPGSPPGLGAGSLAGLLAISNPSAGVVRIAAGVGMALGYLFISDGNVDFNINGDPGQANATDLIVLRRDGLATTPQIRLARVKATSPASTAAVTQNATTWEVALAEVLLDGGGQFSAVTDVRTLVRAGLGTAVLISVAVGTGASGTISFQNIPPFFRQLKVVGAARSDGAGTVGNLTMLINNDSGNNYSQSRITGQNGAVANTVAAATSAITLGSISASGGVAGSRDGLDLIIEDVQNAAAFKTLNSRMSSMGDGTTGAFGVALEAVDAWWHSASRVSRLDLIITPSGNFTADSVIYLYGLF
jgi:hypothetical protein